MKLSSLLGHDLVLWDVDATTRQDAYLAISKLMAQRFQLNQQTIYDAFSNRDELGHAVMGNGFLVPHARIEGLDDLIVIAVKLRQPVQVDGGTADFFFSILTSQAGSNLYLLMQAAIIQLIRKHGDELKQCDSPAAFFKLVEHSGITLGKRLTASQIMTTPVVGIRPQDTVLFTLDTMKKHNVTFLPVLDEHGLYLGKIDLLDILNTVYPDYLQHMSNLAFLSELRAFETLAEREAATLVKDVFKQSTEKTVEADLSVIALGFTFLKHHWHHATVLDENGHAVGVVSLKNILHQVVRL